MSGTSTLSTWWARRPPAVGVAVMATGILAIGLHRTGFTGLFRIALVLTAVAWLGLVVDIIVRAFVERGRWPAEAGSPTALAPVAASATLGTGLSVQGRQTAAEALLALAAVWWAVLIVPEVRAWERPLPGSVFLGCVATQALSVLGASLSAVLGVAWLAHTAMVFFWLGLLGYLAGLWCFDPRELVRGAGDHWVAVGALAISALSGAELVAAAHSGMYLWANDDNHALRGMTVTVLFLALVGYGVLAVAEVLRPRTGYDPRRWATVFPLGMTATAVLAFGSVFKVSWLRGPGQVLLWIAVAAWCAVLVGAMSSAAGRFRSRAPR
ncbi:tellurite resistance/C4-dicarboxylate transporter family protein [Streptomyces sp. NPDC048664]|uniref:tellurite resistance/C4-dicarboxylate transporter family protein n=1 Tax=Streptomyces sp. NPDC048664 TaxID=3154505 RepID=UPI00343AA2DA